MRMIEIVTFTALAGLALFIAVKGCPYFVAALVIWGLLRGYQLFRDRYMPSVQPPGPTYDVPPTA